MTPDNIVDDAKAAIHAAGQFVADEAARQIAAGQFADLGNLTGALQQVRIASEALAELQTWRPVLSPVN